MLTVESLSFIGNDILKLAARGGKRYIFATRRPIREGIGMAQSKKIRVAVLYGGRSGEHEVSLRSAANVIQQLDRNLFEVVPVGIDKQGTWYLGDDILKKELDGSQQLQLSQAVDKMLFNPESLGKQLVPNVAPLTQTKMSERLFDVVFPVIHGSFCEDGTVQGLLELADLPYVGCGVLSSAIGMDKDVSKRLIREAGINVPNYIAIKHGVWLNEPTKYCEAILQKLTFPVFVKPANTGSSVGITKVKSKEDLATAINLAFRFDTKVMVEQGIDAIELEVAALESLEASKDPIVSVVGEIRPRHEFYSYEAKYLDEHGALLCIPAEISADLQEEVRATAMKIFTVLECEGMARVDLFLERGTNKIYFNEINTIPGFTTISMYPKMMTASGIQYSEMLTHLIRLAINRHKNKSQLCREYTVA